MTDTRPLVLYHANCLDGFGAAYAAYRALGSEAEYRAVKYGELTHATDVTNLVSGREVYILDFSFPVPIMETILREACYVVWLDHHKSAFDSWCGPDYLTDKRQKYLQVEHALRDEDHGDKCHLLLDNTKSGALLAWEFFSTARFPGSPREPVPYGYKLIDDYDRWQFALGSDAKAFHKAMFARAPWTFAQWADLEKVGAFEHKELLKEGYALLRAHNQQVRAVVNGGAMGCIIPIPDSLNGVDFSLLAGKAANCPPNLTSDVGHELAVMCGTFGLCWYLGYDGKVNCSLRSNGDYDVASIAGSFGGGGHKNAAGFTTDLATLTRWLHYAEPFAHKAAT